MIDLTPEELNRLIEHVSDERITEYMRKRDYPDVKIFLLPGGTMPERKTPEAEGFDASLRAVVDAHHMDTENKSLRKTIFDFMNVPKDDLKTQGKIELTPGDNGNEWGYRIEPNESVLVGVGFVVEMAFPMFHWVAPRSGLAAKWNITINNAPGTVDSDYRGEAGVLIKNNNDRSYLLKKDMRIAQIIFQRAVIPNLIEVRSYGDLSHTSRGAGGFGSTGIR